MATLGRIAQPCVTTMAATATMASDTAIGTFSTTSTRTAPKRSNITVMARCSVSLNRFGERSAITARGRSSRDDEIGEMRELSDDDKRRRDRYHRLHHAHRNRGQTHHRVRGEHRRDPYADGTNEGGEDDHQRLRHDAH